MALYINLLKFRQQIPNCAFVLLHFSTKLSRDQEYKKCYDILEIPENSDHYAIREAYLTKVRQFHPDSCKDGDTDKFLEIDRAFRMLMDKKAKERWGVEDSENNEESEIKHVVPQHRQYLNYNGIGYGTPYQREKQYHKMRAAQASQNVLKHRIEKANAEEKSLTTQNHKIKTKYGFDRLVEDLIQEAMSTGKFNNLSGCGKPLPDVHEKNPYLDFVTHKLNEVLIQNGFTPEWISLQKEIRKELQVFRNTLFLERINFPPYPLSIAENIEWTNIVYEHKPLIDNINKKINHYNLVVPILERQMMLASLSKEAQQILIKGKSNKDVIRTHAKKDIDESENVQNETFNLSSLMGLLFKKSS